MVELIVANTAEAFATLLDRAGLETERARHERDLAGRALFWGGEDRIIIVPTPVDSALADLTRRLLGSKRLEIWHPRQSSLRLCRDILADANLQARLRAAEKDGGPFQVRPYAVTPEFCALSAAMGWVGWKAALDAATELDSKAGFRRALGGSSLILPEGWICDNYTDVAAAVHALAASGRSAAVKVHNGESGWGLRFVPAGDADDLPVLMSAIRSLFASDHIWAAGPYVVEELIDHDREDTGFSPSGEATVDEEGVRFDYLCDQVVSAEGEFEGVCIGKGAGQPGHAEAIEAQTLIVGEVLRARGYRGTFDVDFIVERSGRLLALESNVRMTGGTHVIGAARALFGRQCRTRTFVSNDCIRYGSTPMPAAGIIDHLEGLLLERGQEHGLILSFISPDRPVLGAIAVGVDRSDAIGQLHALESRLRECRPDC